MCRSEQARLTGVAGNGVNNKVNTTNKRNKRVIFFIKTSFDYKRFQMP